jgi:hypothetical protein
VIVLKNLGESRRHERFSKANDITNEDAVTFVEVVRGDFDGSDLVIEQATAKFRRDAKLGKSRMKSPWPAIRVLIAQSVSRNCKPGALQRGGIVTGVLESF